MSAGEHEDRQGQSPPAGGGSVSSITPVTSAEPAFSTADAPQTYETAAARVEEIIRRLDSGEASLNETLELVGEGKALIEFCAHELRAVSGALEELRLDELVARLESQASDS
ncbi:MAG TPA: exodeoxyribonuclease VII small subunit [Solirubrobacteraceae bacterium]|jgi:exodeoxyribonuclease VII small subunit